MGRRLLLVGRGSVDPRNRNVEQPEVHRQLGAVMDDVVDPEAAVHAPARRAEDRMRAGFESPRIVERILPDPGESRSRRRYALVEQLEQLLAALAVSTLVRRAIGRAEIELVLGDDVGRPVRHLRDMRGELTEAHGFGVRLPVELGFGDALEEPAGGRHFLIDFRQIVASRIHGGSGVMRRGQERRWVTGYRFWFWSTTG